VEELDIEIGLKLKKLREELGLSLREAAKRIDVDHSYIGKIEKGKIPSLKILKKLCRLYGITVSSLFGEEAEVPTVLKDLGIEWITHVENMKNKDLTPEQVEKMVEVVRSINKLKDL
jgi:transcriptional regulator with XRE-family HTH domain